MSEGPAGDGHGSPGPGSAFDWGAAPAEEDTAASPFASAAPRYELGGVLGAGGMGVVHVATDAVLERQVAHKRARSGSEAALRSRFVREARITAFLEHPAIVPVYDAGEDASGEPFYTMRLVRGRTLTEAVAAGEGLRGRLRLLRHFLDACEAVAYAHRHGIVHRDLKPDNVLVGEFGETQVVDWGLARRVSPPGSASEQAPRPQQLPALEGDGDLTPEGETRVGAVIGTPTWMSPEQARGEPADARSDVWSLGLVLYHLIAGALPRPRTEQQPQALRSGALPPLEEQAPDAPADLVAIARRALAPDPAERYPDAKGLADDIAAFLDGRLVGAHAYSPWEQLTRLIRAWRRPLAVAAVALVLLAALGAWAVRRTSAERDRAVGAERQTRQAMERARDHLQLALVQKAQAAFAAGDRARAEVFAVETLRRGPSPEARGVIAGFATSSRPRLIARYGMPACQSVTPSPDGVHIACAEGEALSLWRLGGAGLKRLWRVALPCTQAVILPDAGLVLTVGGRHQQVPGRLRLADGARLPPSCGPINCVVHPPMYWQPHSATGSVLEVADKQLRRHAEGGVKVVAEGDLGLTLTTGGQSLDGRRIAAITSDGVLRLFDAAGKAQPGWIDVGIDHRQSGAVGLLWLDDKRVVAAARSGLIVTVDVAAGRVLQRRRLPDGEARLMRSHPRRGIVAILGERGGILLWHPETGAILGRLPADGVSDLRFSPSGDELWTYGATVARWGLPDGLRPMRFVAGPDAPGLAFARLSPDTRHVVLGPGNGLLQVRDVLTGRRVFDDRFQGRVLKDGHFSADGARFYVGAVGAPSFRAYRAQPWRPGPTASEHGCRRVLSFPSGRRVIAHFGFGISELAPGSDRAVRVPDRPRTSDAVQPHDRKVAWIVDHTGDLWRMDDAPGAPSTNVAPGLGATQVAVSGDGALLAVSQTDAIALLAPQGARVLRTLPRDRVRIYDLALTREGRRLATGRRDGRVHLHSTADGALLAVMDGHKKLVSSVRFSRDDRWLVSGSWDGTAHLWDLGAVEQPVQELIAEVEGAWGVGLDDVLKR